MTFVFYYIYKVMYENFCMWKQVRDTRPTGEFAARTLLITDIPKHQCTVENLTEYFKYVYMYIFAYKREPSCIINFL